MTPRGNNEVICETLPYYKHCAVNPSLSHGDFLLRGSVMLDVLAALWYVNTSSVSIPLGWEIVEQIVKLPVI